MYKNKSHVTDSQYCTTTTHKRFNHKKPLQKGHAKRVRRGRFTKSNQSLELARTLQLLFYSQQAWYRFYVVWHFLQAKKSIRDRQGDREPASVLWLISSDRECLSRVSLATRKAVAIKQHREKALGWLLLSRVDLLLLFGEQEAAPSIRRRKRGQTTVVVYRHYWFLVKLL